MKRIAIVTTALVLSIGTTVYLSSCNNDDTKTTSEHADHKNADENAHTATINDPLMKTMDDMMKSMDQVEITGDFDYDFANMMIPHHQGAIDMAEAEVEHGKDEQIKAMAQKIIDAQKKEIEQMKAIVKDHTVNADKEHMHSHGGHSELETAMDKMMKDMHGMQMSGDTDKDFVAMMIPHHEGAIEMAKHELSHGKVLALKKMAQQMISDQNKEIAEFKAWLEQHK